MNRRKVKKRPGNRPLGPANPLPFAAERTSNRCISIRMAVTAGWQQWFLLRADAHHDHPSANQPMERRHLDLAIKRNAGILDFGDCLCLMQGRHDKRRGTEEDKREEDRGHGWLNKVVKHAAKFYAPYAGNWLLLGRGNHEEHVSCHADFDATEALADRLSGGNGRPPYAGEYDGWIRFLFTIRGTRRQRRALYWHHGAGGIAMMSFGTLNVRRRASYMPDADIIVGGHTHEEWLKPLSRVRFNAAGRESLGEQLHIQIPGYKETWMDGRSWEKRRQFPPTTNAACWLRFWWENETLLMEATRAQ